MCKQKTSQETSNHSKKKSFVFMVKSSETSPEYSCCSAFVEGERDYEENQRQRTILKKVRVKISTNEIEIFFNRLD